MKRWLILLILVAFSQMITGCWNRREIETLGFVIGVGIDTSNEGYMVSSQVANTHLMGKDSQKGPGYFVYTASGETTFDAIRKSLRVAPNKLFWAHNKVIIFSEDVAKQDLEAAVGFFRRDPEERQNVSLAITEGKARDIIRADVNDEPVPVQGLEKILKVSKVRGTVPQLELSDFFRLFRTETCLLVPVVRIEHQQATNKDLYNVDGSGVLKKGKFITYFTPVETLGVNWVNGKIKNTLIVTKRPGASGDGPKDNIAFEVFEEKPQIKVIRQKNHFVIQVNIKETAKNLAESPYTNNEIDPFRVADLEKAEMEIVKSEIQAAILKARREKVDVFGFGESIHRAYPKAWIQIKDHWDNIFPTLDVSVSVEGHLTGTALVLRKEILKP